MISKNTSLPFNIILNKFFKVNYITLSILCILASSPEGGTKQYSVRVLINQLFNEWYLPGWNLGVFLFQKSEVAGSHLRSLDCRLTLFN